MKATEKRNQLVAFGVITRKLYRGLDCLGAGVAEIDAPGVTRRDRSKLSAGSTMLG